MTIRDVYQSDNKNTTYGEFSYIREQKHGRNSGALYDPDSGYSPMTRWLAKAFDYSDFVSSPQGRTGHVAQLPIPRGSIVLRCVTRVDTAFVGTGNTDIDIGDPDDQDGWADGISFATTGVKIDGDADYNWHADGTGVFYDTGGTVQVLFQNATAPTAGEAIVFLEIISYHEDLSKEW